MSNESNHSVTGAPGTTVETMNSFAGKRALITGASSGLGLEFADLLPVNTNGGGLSYCHPGKQALRIVWFCLQRAFIAQLAGERSGTRDAGGQDHFDPRSIGPNPTGEAKAVSGAWHLHIREHEVDAVFRLHHCHGFLGAGRFEHAVAARAQVVGELQSNQNLVFHDENGLG